MGRKVRRRVRIVRHVARNLCVFAGPEQALARFTDKEAPDGSRNPAAVGREKGRVRWKYQASGRAPWRCAPPVGRLF